jgi:hypothetical protein
MSRKTGFFIIMVILWITAMVFIYRNYIKTAENNKEYVTSDITYDSETRHQYEILKDGQKIGYRTEIWLKRPNLVLCTEETVIKINMAGLSKEVFFQSVVGIDSTSHISRQIQFTLASGTHTYVFEGAVSGDSLNIKVKKNSIEPKRDGTFITDEYITYPVALPFFMHASNTETMSFMVFDPVIFSIYHVDCTRRGLEDLVIENKKIQLERYELRYADKQALMWLDKNGTLVKAEGYMFFGGDLGDFSVEKSTRRDVFLLPMDVTFGNDIIKSFTIIPDKPIPGIPDPGPDALQWRRRSRHGPVDRPRSPVLV